MGSVNYGIGVDAKESRSFQGRSVKMPAVGFVMGGVLQGYEGHRKDVLAYRLVSRLRRESATDFETFQA